MNEQRLANRKILKAKVMLAMTGGQPVNARSFDISTEGIGLALEEPVTPGQAGQLAFEMYFDGQSHRVFAKVKVAYCIFSGGEFKTGFQFTNLDSNALAAIAKYVR